jgi:hypothetical protein
MPNLPDFPVRKQDTPFTCGLCSMSLVSTYLGHSIEENEIPPSLLLRLAKGFPPADFPTGLRKLLPGYDVELTSLPSEKIPGVLRKQLENGLPVPILFATPNDFKPENIVIHYSVVTALDPENATVTLSNPFGYLQNLSLKALLEQMAFLNFPRKPFTTRLALFLGALKPNTLFLIQKK